MNKNLRSILPVVVGSPRPQLFKRKSNKSWLRATFRLPSPKGILVKFPQKQKRWI